MRKILYAWVDGGTSGPIMGVQTGAFTPIGAKITRINKTDIFRGKLSYILHVLYLTCTSKKEIQVYRASSKCIKISPKL